LKPDIIMLSLSAMGHSGPWKDYTGFGPTVQAFSGIANLTSYPGEPPSGIGYSYADHVSGLYGSLALLGALEYRRQTGKGQYIDLSQTEAMTSLLADPVLEYTKRGIESFVGNASLRSAPNGVYRCSGNDRWCAISVTTEKQWKGFKRALGNPGWAKEERFATMKNRLQNVKALDSLIQGWSVLRPAEEVMKILQKQGVPAGVVQNAADLASDPQLRDRGFFIELEHQVLGKTITDASPIRLSESPAEYKRAAPEHGQDNEYVYSQLLGLSGDQINGLKEKGVI
jgi:crotonobetainyl-CoA:carnitine CoA-transferase CaiB-like acyl-CoA transferase